MSLGKHSSDKKKFTKFDFSNIIKILLLLLIIFIISIAIYYFVTYILSNPIYTDSNIENTNNLEPIYEASETVSTNETLVVKGAEYLEITGVFINSDDPKLSTVSTKIKNKSDISHKNLELCITLLDINNETLTTLDCTIDKIEPNEETITYCAIMQDLSNCANYSIAISTK